MAFGTEPTPTGLATPSIDDLMKHADSKYALAIFAAKRARQINSYFTQLNEGLLNTRARTSRCPSHSVRSTKACWRRLSARTI